MGAVTALADPATPVRPPNGQPRSAVAAARLETYNRYAKLPIILSALLPLIIAPEQGNWVAVTIGIVSWLVFVYDFVTHERLLEHYLGTRLGKFDLSIVVLTAPWFLLPGAQGGSIVVLLRLARLARLVIASRGAKNLFARLGRVAIVAVSVMVVGAVVAYYAEHPTNPGFATFGDALWWSIVTLTTVGYGDIVPHTTTGRLDAATIMVTGVSVLGILAGSLASFMRLQPSDPSDSGDPSGSGGSGGAGQPGPPPDPTLADVMAELALLRTQVAALTSLGTDSASSTEPGP
jgi:voltage-gated potassium channel